MNMVYRDSYWMLRPRAATIICSASRLLPSLMKMPWLADIVTWLGSTTIPQVKSAWIPLWLHSREHCNFLTCIAIGWFDIKHPCVSPRQRGPLKVVSVHACDRRHEFIYDSAALATDGYRVVYIWPLFLIPSNGKSCAMSITYSLLYHAPSQAHWVKRWMTDNPIRWTNHKTCLLTRTCSLLRLVKKYFGYTWVPIGIGYMSDLCNLSCKHTFTSCLHEITSCRDLNYLDLTSLLGFSARVRMKGWISFSIRIFFDSLGSLPFSPDFGCYHSPPTVKWCHK